MTGLQIIALAPGAAEIALCARWRTEAFADVLQASPAAEEAALEAFVAGPPEHVMLLAKLDGVPAGTCLLVPSEIAPLHPVSPWLAGLYVLPRMRARGIGRALIAEIECRARAQGHARLYLYTDTAEHYYARLGWCVDDRRTWFDKPTVLMRREIDDSG